MAGIVPTRNVRIMAPNATEIWQVTPRRDELEEARLCQGAAVTRSATSRVLRIIHRRCPAPLRTKCSGHQWAGT